MCNKKLSCVVCLAVVMVLVGSAFAQNNWTNAAGNGRWMDPNNWSLGVVPGPGTGNTRINPDTNADPNNLVGPTIGVGEIALTDAMDNWGPEWGLTINIEGGSLTSAGFVSLVSVGGETNPSSINLGKDGSGGWLDLINFLIGDSWWYSGGPYVTFNQWSGTAIVRDYVWLGGKMNLFGGILYVFNGFNVAVAGQPASLTTINVEGGILMLPAEYTATVEKWVADGYCVAYGGAGQIVIEEVGGRTKVTAVAPAPVTP